MKRFRSISRTKKIVTVGVAAALVLGIGGAAFAYFTTTGSGTGSAPIGDASPLTVTVGTPTGGALFPTSFTDGNRVVDTVTYTVTNPGDGNVNLSTVVMEVTPGFSYTDAAGDPACTAVDFSINGQAVGTPAIAALDVTLNGVSDSPNNVYNGSFTIQMVENGANQDSCQSGSVPLTVTANPTANPNLLSSIDYYVINQGGIPWTRSTTPFSVGVASQSVSSGSVSLSIASGTGYADNGFYLTLGTLGSLNGYTITGTGSSFGTNLYFGYGSGIGTDFFTWSGNTYAGYGLTTDSLGPASSGGIDIVNGSSSFYIVNGTCSGDSETLTQLKGGACGMTSSTPVAMWVGITSPSGAPLSTTITSVQAY
ncbi:MAG: hypothetical protein ACLP36_07840 [Acidimicrobiales bacterium]